MNCKLLIIELFQASSFAAIIAFLFGIIGIENIKYASDVSNIAGFCLVFGGVPIILAKRFVVSF